VRIEHTGTIQCIACGRSIRKSFSQGHCYPCFRSLARCDRCIVSPERCHYHLGTCREPAWGEAHCLRPHVVYLANASGVKVGITRRTQIPTRWIDQGAVAAVPLLEVASRRASGIVETALKESFADRTNWRRMLRGAPPPVDLEAARVSVLDAAAALDAALELAGVDDRVVPLRDAPVVRLRYPVESCPEPLRAIDLARSPQVQGTLTGIKGQYLMLDCGVLNVRRHAGYEVRFEAG
jgi:hypothetical protein